VPVWPTAGVSPATGLATAIYAAPGVYAALLGSGISRAAGVPTGWDVVQDLIRRVAAAEGVNDERLICQPEAWWAEQGYGEPRYDELLAAVAPTDAARQALLRSYFDATPEGEPLLPTAAHHALANLAAQGRIRVIVTTNFDRLTERALDGVGISAQVLSNPDSVDGMIPLVHSPVTVVKVHGDFASLPLRNTPSELGSYPKRWRRLLRQVFDEYGLLVVGWSAEWDVALVRALTSSPNRRYPTFWAARQGRVSEAAARVIAQRAALIVPVHSADDLFTDLQERLRRLDTQDARSDSVRFRNAFLFPDRLRNNGWVQIPMLTTRVSAQYGPATSDTVGVLGAATRAALAAALDGSPLTERIRALADTHDAATATRGASTAEATSGPPQPSSLPANSSQWQRPPDSYLTTTDVNMRLGSDGAQGVSALMTVRGPGMQRGDSVTVFVDIGLSVTARLSLTTIALLLRDQLLLLANTIPDVLGTFLPADARATMFGLLVEAPTTDVDGANRDNDLGARVDLCNSGQPANPTVGSLGLSFDAPTIVTSSVAETAIIDGLSRMLLDRGYPDAEMHLAQVKADLDATDEPTPPTAT
jgi:hypothetical protein